MFRRCWKLWTARSRSPVVRRNRACQPRLEALEDRLPPATHIWQGPIGGLWSGAGNWSGGVPTTGESGGTIVQFNSASDSTDDILNLVIGQIHFTADNNTIRGTTHLGINGSTVSPNLLDAAGISDSNFLDSSLPIVLSGSTVQATFPGDDVLTIGGNISGTGGLTLAGNSNAALVLTGANTYSGATTISAGFLDIGDRGPTGTLGTGAVTINGTLTFDRTNTLVVANVISGTGTLEQAGSISGTTILTGSSTSAGLLDIPFGTLNASATTLTVGEVLQSGTLIAPATTLNVGGGYVDTIFDNSGTFTANGGTVVLSGTDMTLYGATTFNNLTKTVAAADTLTFAPDPNSGANKTTVTGTLTLQGAAGNLLSLRSATAGTQWPIDPQGSRSVAFVDVKDSANVNATAISATGSADSGNNTNWAISGSGPLIYTSSGGTVTLRKNGSNLEVLQGAAVVKSAPLASVTAVTINGANNQTNQLTIDYTFGGTFTIPGGGTITYQGGVLPGSTNSLVIQGGSFDRDTYTYSSAHNGTVQLGLGGQLISYTNLAPLTNTGTAADIIFSLPGGTVGATLQDDGTPSNNMSQLASTNATFETTTFTEPTNSLTVNAGGGTDTINTAANLSGDFHARLSLNGTAATDTVTLNALNLMGTLMVTGQTINVDSNVTTVGDQSYNGPVILGAANGTTVSLVASGGTVAFASSVNATTAGQQGLSVTGNASFGGVVGTLALRSLAVSGTTALNTPVVTTSSAGGGSGDQTYTSQVTLGSDVTLTSVTLSLPGGVQLSNHTLGINNSGGALIAGAITGGGGLTQAGMGTTTLTGNNTYGTTTINAGTLQIGHGGPTGMLGTGAVTDNGVLGFNRSNTLTVANAISGTGALLQVAGTTILSGANAYSGVTTISAGTLQVGRDNVIPSASAVILENTAGSTLDLNNFNDAIGSLAGGGPLGGNVMLGSGTLTTGGDNTSTIYSGVISDSLQLGGLTKVGSGYFTLAGTNLYSGPTTISAGHLTVGNAGPTGTLGTGAVTDNGVLGFNRSNTLTVANAISGTGALLQVAGTTILSGANAYSGATTISAGTLQVGRDNVIPSASAVILENTAGSTLDLNNFNDAIGSLAGGGSNGGDVTLGRGTLTTGGDNTSTTYFGVISGPGGLTKQGSGTFTLSGVNTYTGPTVISAGMLVAGVPNAIPAASPVMTNSVLVFNPTDTLTVANVISGTGGLTQAGTGTLILTGANSYSGGTTISAGTLQIDNDNELGAATGGLTLSGGTLRTVTNSITANRALTVTAASTLDVAAGTTFTLDSAISGSGNLVKTNLGDLTLAGSGSYAGTLTFVASGTLLVTGSLPNASVTVSAGTVVAGTGTIGTLSDPGGAILRPGSTGAAGNVPGTLTTGNNTNLTNFTYETDVSGSAAAQHNMLQVAGNADLGGATLALNINPSFPSSPGADTPLTLVSTTDALSGTFAGLPNNATFTTVVKGTPLTFRITYSSSAATLTYVPIVITFTPAALGQGGPAGTVAGTLSTTSEVIGQVVLPIFSLPSGAAPDNGLFAAGLTQLDGTASLTTQFVANFAAQSSFTILVQADTGLGIVQRTFTLTVDRPPLTVTVNQTAGQGDPTNNAAITFTVVFSQALATNFTTGDVTLSGTTGATTPTVSGSGTTYTVAVTGMAQSGTVAVTVPAGVVRDANGTANAASTSSDNTVTYSTTPLPPAKLYAAAEIFAHSREHYTQFVTTAYQQYLKRLPDPTGLEYWVSNMLAKVYSDPQVEALFLNSQEYVTGHGGIGAGWIIGMYQDLLGRTPTDGEVQTWLNVLNGGTSPYAVAYGFTDSLERAIQRIRFNYQTYLGRTPGQDEIDLWVNSFEGGASNEDMVAGFIASPEYYYNGQKGEGNEEPWIEQAYRDVLFREASTAEINLWLQFLA